VKNDVEEEAEDVEVIEDDVDGPEVVEDEDDFLDEADPLPPPPPAVPRLTVNPLKQRDNSAAARLVKLTSADILPAPDQLVALLQAARNTIKIQASVKGEVRGATETQLPSNGFVVVTGREESSSLVSELFSSLWLFSSFFSSTLTTGRLLLLSLDDFDYFFLSSWREEVTFSKLLS